MKVLLVLVSLFALIGANAKEKTSFLETYGDCIALTTVHGVTKSKEYRFYYSNYEPISLAVFQHVGSVNCESSKATLLQRNDLDITKQFGTAKNLLSFYASDKFGRFYHIVFGKNTVVISFDNQTPVTYDINRTLMLHKYNATDENE